MREGGDVGGGGANEYVQMEAKGERGELYLLWITMYTMAFITDVLLEREHIVAMEQ